MQLLANFTRENGLKQRRNTSITQEINKKVQTNTTKEKFLTGVTENCSAFQFFESSSSYWQLFLCLETYFYAISFKLVLVNLCYCKVLYWIITNNNNIISKLKKRWTFSSQTSMPCTQCTSKYNELESSLLTITNV